MNEQETKRAIHLVCRACLIDAPLINLYENIATVAFRNNLFDRVCVPISYADTLKDIETKIIAANEMDTVSDQEKRYDIEGSETNISEAEYPCPHMQETTSDGLIHVDDAGYIRNVDQAQKAETEFDRQIRLANEMARGTLQPEDRDVTEERPTNLSWRHAKVYSNGVVVKDGDPDPYLRMPAGKPDPRHEHVKPSRDTMKKFRTKLNEKNQLEVPRLPKQPD